MKEKSENISSSISFEDFKNQILADYKTIVLSRECSYLGRKEVLSGKAKFGIFGDGKELPQVAMSHFFEKGDFRSGYYRDQTLLFAQENLTPEQLFAALYADLDLTREPMSGGRQMGAHFVTPFVDENGNWLPLKEMKNHSSDISPTASQMPRLVGLAQASKLFREIPFKGLKEHSDHGNEIAWGTIGNASTSEGVFFEAINAAGVLQIPMVVSVWDDDYGISVHNKDHTTKESISEALKGFQRTETAAGLEVLEVKGWNYSALINTYDYASQLARKEHVPVLIHVKELTQPLGHSSSGSHERYKSEERLKWEKEYDCNVKMRAWVLANGIATEEELISIESELKTQVKKARRKAWNDYQNPVLKTKKAFISFLESFKNKIGNDPKMHLIKKSLDLNPEPSFRDVVAGARQLRAVLTNYPNINTQQFDEWRTTLINGLKEKISSKLYTVSKEEIITMETTPPTYSADAPMVDGRIILRDNFEALLKKDERVFIFGEDVGKIGDVNQGLEGLQKKFGPLRIADTGIREATIIGQGIGLSLRGLRPIAEIQYLDYILYCIQILSDDLASLSYRTNGQQFAPLIIRTRGHRLEGIWHSGSQMGGMIHLLRGIHILVPRNMTQAAGFYNTLLALNQPAILVESLNGYRLKEKMPNNLGKYKIPLGEIECLQEGNDITAVSYGSTLRILSDAAKTLQQYNISIEVIDIQTLIPFDLAENIVLSIAKTNRLLIVDEDVPGGASAYILQQLLEKQKAFKYLDSPPKLLAAKAHRPAYGSDGDYFSKPSHEDIFEAAYAMMHESDPQTYPAL